jgi:hypothetical protein
MQLNDVLILIEERNRYGHAEEESRRAQHFLVPRGSRFVLTYLLLTFNP